MPAATQGHAVLRVAVLASCVLLLWRTSSGPTPDFVNAAGLGERLETSPVARKSLRGHVIGAAALSADAAAAEQPWSSFGVSSLAAMAVAMGVLLGGSSSAHAFFGTGNSGEIIGELEASGLIFKDTINVERITDPKVTGVTLYQTDFSKSSFDKLKAGNLMQADPSASGLACAVDGKVLVKKDISTDKKGEEIFSESKSFIGKTLKVKRVFDEKSKNVVYVVFTERANKDDDPNGSRFKSQACAVHVDGVQQ